MTRSIAEQIAHAMSEDQLLANVRGSCKRLSIYCYHTHDSRRSEKGFPDTVMIGRHGMLFRELKDMTRKLTVEQDAVLIALRRIGQDADVWRPIDWPDRILRELAAIR